MFFRKMLISMGFVLATTTVGQADLPAGLWESTPDTRGLIVHVRTRPCGSAMCGKVERAKNARGYDTPSTAVGSKVLMDLAQQSDGTYLGKFWASDQGRLMTARVRLQGNEMMLNNCDGAGCRNEVWKRLR